MSATRPVDLPEARAEMIDLFHDPRSEETWSKIWSTVAGSPLTGAMGTDPHELQEVFQKMLQAADLFWVAAPMAELAETAAVSMPDFTLRPEDVPSQAGYLHFERPVTAASVAVKGRPEPSEYEISGLLWGPVSNFNGSRKGVIVYALMGDLPVLVPTQAIVQEYGQELPQQWHGRAAYYGVMLACWLLMKQPLAEVAHVDPDRAARKRMMRTGHKPAPVRVIELRRPKSTGDQGAGESNYQHQWIVRGHWRNHWHPRRQVHRPVWIAPHIKGPEGAPMIGGEKVYALRGDPAPAAPAEEE